MLSVACLVPHPVASPSSRIRVAQYAPALRNHGIELRLAPFFDDDAYARLYQAGAVRRAVDTARAFVRRAGQIRRAREADAVLVHREIAPFLGAPFLRALEGGPPVLFDLDDAVFLPAPGGSPWLRFVRRPQAATEELIRGASVCLAGNSYLAEFVQRAGGRAVHLPTVVDTGSFRPASAWPDGDAPLRISWVGTHSTQDYLDLVVPALRRLASERPVEITVVSNRPPAHLGGIAVRGVRWSLENEVSYFQEADVGLYPVPDDPWTRGKCGAKAIQYMACAVPVVASPVGVLTDLVQDGVTGFLADDEEAWLGTLQRLGGDAELRRRLGAAGRGLVESRYSLEVGAGVLADAIRSVVGRVP